MLGEFFSFLFVRLCEIEVKDVFSCDRVTLGNAHYHINGPTLEISLGKK